MARYPLLEHLDEQDRRATLALARRRKFRRNEAIFHEGDPGDSMHLIDRGHVAIRITTPDGDIATVRILGPGDQFGEMAAFFGEPRTATAVALDAVETMSLHKDVIATLRRDHRAIERAFLDASLREVARLSSLLTEVVHESVPKRMARHLARLRLTFDGDVIPLTQDDLAGLCGTTRQTANQVLQDLQSNGIIEVARGKVHVTDPDLLARAAR